MSLPVLTNLICTFYNIEAKMNFPQPKVNPLPPNIDPQGKTVLTTGATAGIGLEIARQLLKFHVSHLVRNLWKGEACRNEIQRLNIRAKITVLELDMKSYENVQRCAKTL